MSSPRRVQTERVLQDIVRLLYSGGKKPMTNDITSRISAYFSRYPAGRPLPMPLEDIVDGLVSNSHLYNKLLKHISVNIDVLYEASLRQIEDILELTSSLQTELQRLDHKRRRIETKIDDLLLSQYNTDGYFYSISDNFSDLSLTNTMLSSVEVDTDAGVVLLPTISSATTSLPIELVGVPNITVMADGSSEDYVELAPFTGALEDSLDNMIWAFEVETEEPQEVIAHVTVRVGNGIDPVQLSRINFTPYGSTPVQVYWETHNGDDWDGFGAKIQTGTTKMVFGESSREANRVRLTMRKTEYDYTENHDGTLRYKYIFGARSLSFIYHVYERNATFVSEPLQMPSDFSGDAAIDAVSIDVKADVPPDTEMRYFVAPSDMSEFSAESLADGMPQISDYVWQEIIPIDSKQPGSKVIRFSGANISTRMIRSEPQGGDLQLIPFESSGPVQERNPTPSIIPGVDVYRIARVQDKPFRNSLELWEGVNATRIHSKNIDNATEFKNIDLPYWADVLADEETTLDYGRIDTGNEFFYGGDVGAVNKDVYVETFLFADRSWDTFLSEFQKVDVRSQTWDVKIYLNGRLLGHLPPGLNKMQLPWRFNQGMNHIVLLVRIPFSAGESDPYMGAVSLLGGDNLYRYGAVHLAKWNYVDLFTMKYNESGQPRTFTIEKNEIISRRPPTTNYQLRYTIETGEGPAAVLLRAELSRSRNNPNVTPALDQYRLRFSYTEE